MPALEQMDRKQWAVLWPADGTDAYGEVLRGDPVEIKVRWTWTKSKSGGNQSDLTNIDATVVAGQEIAEGSLMWLGRLLDWVGTGSGYDENELMEVVRYEKGYDLLYRSKNVRHNVSLRYYRDTPPRSS